MSKSSVTISFDNPEVMRYFVSWLEESGEQEYWMWQEAREFEDESECITALEFDYSKSEKGIVTTKCGRFTAERE